MHLCVREREFTYVLHTHSHSRSSVHAETLGFHKHHNSRLQRKCGNCIQCRAAVSVVHNVLSLREDFSFTLVWVAEPSLRNNHDAKLCLV